MMYKRTKTFKLKLCHLYLFTAIHLQIKLYYSKYK